MHPWWSVQLPLKETVLAVGIQTTTECNCVADLTGAQIMVGNVPWTSVQVAPQYTLCATVTGGIVRGQRKLFTCSLGKGGAPPSGRYIAIWRPDRARTTLTLCEVDAVFSSALPPQKRLRRSGRRLHAASSATVAAQQQWQLQHGELLPQELEQQQQQQLLQ